VGACGVACRKRDSLLFDACSGGVETHPVHTAVNATQRIALITCAQIVIEMFLCTALVGDTYMNRPWRIILRVRIVREISSSTTLGEEDNS
jgi:hypothetical protein